MGDDASSLHARARRLVQALYVSVQGLRLYPLENETVQRSLDDLHRVVGATLSSEGTIDLRIVGDFFYLNETRLRTDLGTYETFGAVAHALARRGIGSVTIQQGVARDELAAFLMLLLKGDEGSVGFAAFAERLAEACEGRVGVSPQTTFTPSGTDDPDRRRTLTARRTYVESVRILKELFGDIARGSGANIRKTKRTVQNIVDRVLEDEASMLAMTTLREFDDYLITHSVNVCVFAVVIGRKLGLGKMELFDLGLAALLFDSGMVGVDADTLNKEDPLDDDDWRRIRSHPALGARFVLGIRGASVIPYRAVLAAYEHHMGVDLTGYPQARRGRAPTLFSRIVALADSFDAALSKRSYRYSPRPPDEILVEILENPDLGMDPLVTKAFIGVLGLYPVGTLVLLDTGELAVVTARSVQAHAIARPSVKIVTDRDGAPLDQPLAADLAEVEPGSGAPLRSVVRALNAQEYDVDVGAYFA